MPRKHSFVDERLTKQCCLSDEFNLQQIRQKIRRHLLEYWRCGADLSTEQSLETKHLQLPNFPEQDRRRGGAGRQARSYFGSFLHFLTTRNKSQQRKEIWNKSKNIRTQRRGRQAGRQARSYFGRFLHFFTTRNKSQKIRNKTDAEEGQAGR